ncbi:MAG: CCA tRNA nucleotidyltransferase [Candidatus Micrarchaeaceae archaeon]
MPHENTLQSAKVSRILTSVLSDIKPTEEEIAIETNQANEIVNRLRRVIPNDVEIRVVGSLAHGTNLRGSSDIDIFLLFSKKKAKSTITKEGLEYARKIAGKGDTVRIKYAEHPYARVYFSSMNAEADIVPAYKIDNIEEMATAVDRSPMHSDFIIKRLTDKQKDEVRLLKQYMKSHGLYGAEVFTGGFSGYLCELLVYYFGSFESVLGFFASSTLPIVLLPEKVRVNRVETEELVKRFNSQFIVIDPVDPNRNVAAPVSIDSLARFVLLSRQFLSKPSIKAFYGTGFSHRSALSEIRQFSSKAGIDCFLLVFKLPDKSEDVLWPQLRRVSEQIKQFVESYGFSISILAQAIQERSGLIMLCAQKQELVSRIVKGPSVFMRDAANAFLRAHKKAIGKLIEKGTIAALEPNRFKTIREALVYVSEGKLRKRHKDIVIKGVKLFVNKIPAQYADTVYANVLMRMRI